jgi:hypothetical protein
MSQLDVSIELLTGGEAMHLESSSDDTRVSLAQLIPHLDKLHAHVLYIYKLIRAFLSYLEGLYMY